MPGTGPDLDSGLAPGFLVAAPSLQDPNFKGSLVLMAEHTDQGALGFVVNRPAPVQAGQVLRAVDPELLAEARAAGRADAAVLIGGPVQPERLWILWRPGVVATVGLGAAVGTGLALGGSRELLASLAGDATAGPYQLFLGYSGWGPMQVEREVAAGAWIPLPLHDDLVFDVPFEVRWEEAVRRLGLSPGEFTVGGGGARA